MTAAGPGQDGARLRVLVVDHCRVMSEALAGRLGQEPDLVVVGLVESSEAAEEALEQLHPAVATVAADLADGGGLVLITRARRSHPAVRWVVVGGDTQPLDVADAVVAGASAYVATSSPVAVLAGALRSAVAGVSVIPENLLRRAIVALEAPGAACLDARRALTGESGRRRGRGRHRPRPRASRS